MRAVHEELVRLLRAGHRVCVATVVGGRGSRPRRPGARMLVVEDGPTLFTIGGGPLEATVTADCREVLRGAQPGVRRYDLTEGGEHGVGMTCGGSVEVFLEVEEAARPLFIFGAGHVGRSLARVASELDLAVTLVDDRAEWLTEQELPARVGRHRCARDYEGDLPEVPPGALAAVMTRCHASDVTVLEALSRTEPAYVGVIGSRRKIARAFRVLEQERGVTRAFLDRVHGPIGLDIGAETPEEIAIAVAAEIVKVVRSAAGRPTGASVGTS